MNYVSRRCVNPDWVAPSIVVAFLPQKSAYTRQSRSDSGFDIQERCCQHFQVFPVRSAAELNPTFWCGQMREPALQ